MTLIERLEAAEAGSRELDALVHVTVADDPNTYVVEPSPDGVFSHRTGWYRTGADLSVLADPVTTSLDAALALAERVLPGWAWELYAAYEIKGVVRYGDNLGEEDTAYAPTPALALCLAILKAKETKT